MTRRSGHPRFRHLILHLCHRLPVRFLSCNLLCHGRSVDSIPFKKKFHYAHRCSDLPRSLVVSNCRNSPCAIEFTPASTQPRWGRGAVGSAPRWHRGGRGFESHRLHHFFKKLSRSRSASQREFCSPSPLRRGGAFPTSPRGQICHWHDFFSTLASSNSPSPFASPPFRIYNPPN